MRACPFCPHRPRGPPIRQPCPPIRIHAAVQSGGGHGAKPAALPGRGTQLSQHAIVAMRRAARAASGPLIHPPHPFSPKLVLPVCPPSTATLRQRGGVGTRGRGAGSPIPGRAPCWGGQAGPAPTGRGSVAPRGVSHPFAQRTRRAGLGRAGHSGLRLNHGGGQSRHAPTPAPGWRQYWPAAEPPPAPSRPGGGGLSRQNRRHRRAPMAPHTRSPPGRPPSRC